MRAGTFDDGGPSPYRPAVRVLLWLTSLTVVSMVSSCSLLGLDQVRVSPCDRCEALNVRDGLEGCSIWQCDEANGYCVLGPPDLDGDLDVSAACGGTDCDDGDDTVAGTANEQCDGVDNDCNGIVDDGPSTAQPVTTLVASVVAPEVVTITPALDDGVLLSWRIGATTSVARVTELALATGLELMSETNADLTRPLASATVVEGCPQLEEVPLAPVPCSAGDVCPGTLRCVSAPDGARVCESAVMNNDPPGPSECLTHASCQDAFVCNGIERCDPRSPLSDPVTGCRTSAPPCDAGTRCDEDLDICRGTVVGDCALDGLALAPASSTEWLAASIDALTCPSGQVRVGSLAASPPVLRHWGDARLSTAWPAVGLDGEGCTRTEGILGASSVALAVLPIDTTFGQFVTEGLAAWRAEPFCEANDCSASADVAILGLWRESNAGDGGDITWVNAASDGRPLVLADAAASAGVAVGAYRVGTGASRRAGYVVGYPTDGGGVTLALVPALGAPHRTCAEGAPPCMDRQPGPDSVLGTADDPEAGTRFDDVLELRTSIALGSPRIESLTESTAITSLSLAVGQDGDGVPILVAYSTETELVLLQLREDPVAGVLTEVGRQRIPSAGVRDLSVTHFEEGLGVVRTGSPITEDTRGGFVVTWSSPAGTFALRVGSSGTVIAPGAVRLTSTASRMPRAFLDRVGSDARVRIAAHQGDAFVSFPSVCGAAL